MARAYFNEIQRFRQWWIYLIIVISIGAWGYAFFTSINASEAEKAAPDIYMIFTGLIPILLVVLLMVLRLETKIRNDGIHYQFKPLQFKVQHIAPEEIVSFEVRKYNPLTESVNPDLVFFRPLAVCHQRQYQGQTSRAGNLQTRPG